MIDEDEKNKKFEKGRWKSRMMEKCKVNAWGNNEDGKVKVEMNNVIGKTK